MPPQFTCPNCPQVHRFLPALAGQSMHCSACGFIFRIPLVPLANPSGIDFSLTKRWLLRLASGRQFGPVQHSSILEWLHEGRADAESLVSPDASQSWYRVGEIFPDAVLKSHTTLTGRTAPIRPADAPSPAAAIPAAGLLDLWENTSPTPSSTRLRAITRQHTEALLALQSEAARAAGLIRSRGSRLLFLKDPTPGRPSLRDRPQDYLEIEAATVTAWLSPLGGEFYHILPYSRLGPLPSEFLSILPGRLPGPLALRRLHESAFDGGKWIGITGDHLDLLALAASASTEALAPGIAWDWFSADRRYHMVPVWGVQAIPLGPEKFAHLIQTAHHPDPASPVGLRWYLERQSAFWRFARRLNLPATPGSPILFASCAARLLTLAAQRLQA